LSKKIFCLRACNIGTVLRIRIRNGLAARRKKSSPFVVASRFCLQN
jgi:hypothetical protein